LSSESAFRFERTVDIEAIDWASMRTARLITQVAGGKVADGVLDIYPGKRPPKEVTLRLGRLNSLLGIKIPPERVAEILASLGFQPLRKDDSILCTVPSWRRSDVYREADFIEEVARVHGYNKIPTERKIKIEVVPVDDRQKLFESVGTYLNGCGFYETISVTFVDNSAARLFTPANAKKHLAVKDVSRKTANLLRQTLISSLLAVLKTNLNAGNTPCRIFEIADTFVPAGRADALPIEKTRLSLACDNDFRYLRGVVEGLVNSIGGDAETVFDAADLCWAEVGAKIRVNGETVGVAGIVSQPVKEKFDFKDVLICAAELDFELLSALQRGPVKFKPIPRFPAIERDLSLIVDEAVAWADIVGAVNKKAPSVLEEVQFVGIYRGRGIPAGQKSVTLSLRFRDEDGTLTHEVVDGFEAGIVDALTEATAAQLRTL
jgi:phenylalanyl-tRNA synthetase beta chain